MTVPSGCRAAGSSPPISSACTPVGFRVLVAGSDADASVFDLDYTTEPGVPGLTVSDSSLHLASSNVLGGDGFGYAYLPCFLSTDGGPGVRMRQGAAALVAAT